MSDIYVPIDYSNAKEKIPPDEDIVYSTLMKVSSGPANYKSKWTSHVLMTTRGISYTIPMGRKVPIVRYEKWNGIYGIMRKQFQIGGTYFKLVRDPNYESKESFKIRIKQFSSTIKPIKKAFKERHIAEVRKRKEEKRKKKQEKKELKKLKKQNKIIYKL